MPEHNFVRPKGRLVSIEIESEVLRSNMLNDPSTRTVSLYLPEGYDEGTQRYPLFVDLVGFTGSGFSHLNWKAFSQSVPQRVDRLIESGAMGPVVVAFPDCFTSLGGNQYINSVAMGMWEDFLIEEMLPSIESQFRAGGAPELRAVFGKSSGGYGSMVHGMLHADVWGAIACHSGDMDFDLVYRPDFPKALASLARHEGSIERFMEHLRSSRSISGGDFHVVMSMAMAATYDPCKDAPYGVRLPVDPHTCVLDQEAWERWLKHDPVHMIERADVVENLKKLKGLYIDCGDQDQYNIQFGTRRLVRSLELLEIEHVYEEFSDNHSGIDYRMDVSLPFMYNSLRA